MTKIKDFGSISLLVKITIISKTYFRWNIYASLLSRKRNNFCDNPINLLATLVKFHSLNTMITTDENQVHLYFHCISLDVIWIRKKEGSLRNDELTNLQQIDEWRSRDREMNRRGLTLRPIFTVGGSGPLYRGGRLWGICGGFPARKD